MMKKSPVQIERVPMCDAEKAAEKYRAEAESKMKERERVYRAEERFSRIVCALFSMLSVVLCTMGFFTIKDGPYTPIFGITSATYLVALTLFLFGRAGAFTLTRVASFFFSGAYAVLYSAEILPVECAVFFAIGGILTLRMPLLLSIIMGAVCVAVFIASAVELL